MVAAVKTLAFGISACTVRMRAPSAKEAAGLRGQVEGLRQSFAAVRMMGLDITETFYTEASTIDSVTEHRAKLESVIRSIQNLSAVAQDLRERLATEFVAIETLQALVADAETEMDLELEQYATDMGEMNAWLEAEWSAV